ncbi:MAG: ABC transporter permease, partial [Chloroflexi bacterium]|nr:ABC transporter permease [Chloroflexota bacterium]
MNRLRALTRIKLGGVVLGLAPVWAILAALLLGSALIAVTGASPIEAYRYLLRGAFGNANSLGDTLIKTTTLVFAGVGMAFAFRCGVFNIGGEGQIYIGALFATVIGLLRLPPVIHLPLALLAGFVGGGLWAAIAGWLKARRGLNEIIVTIFMNYIAVILVSYFVTGPLKEPPGYYPQTAEVAVASQLPVILPGSRLHAGLLLALVSAVVIWVVLRRTSLGFQVRAVGANP